MAHKSLKNVVIVGGGSSGWVTAAMLKKYLGDRVDVTVIEPSNIPPIGVGEATIPSIKNVLKDLEIDEYEFMKATDGIFKQSIRFEGWVTGHTNDVYYHPFELANDRQHDFAHQYVMAYPKDRLNYARITSLQIDAMDRYLSPKLDDSEQYKGSLGYAYHIDAIKFGQFLKKYSMNIGVKHIDDVVDSVTEFAGNIFSINLKEHGEKKFDLYVDCSGFRKLLISKLPSAHFESFAHFLKTNRAVAIQVPIDKEFDVIPFTGAVAQDAGWIWQIGLKNRYGSGYVYSDNHISQDEAEKILRDFWGGTDQPVQHIKIDVGAYREQWVGNCVAIGLSAGFIEPLESTGLHLAYQGAMRLVDAWPKEDEAAYGKRENFNLYMMLSYQEAAAFVGMHYLLSQRRDTAFWRDVTKPEDYPDYLLRLLDRWKTRMPVKEDFAKFRKVFGHLSWRFILEAYSALDTAKIENEMPHDQLDQIAKAIFEDNNEYMNKLKNNEEWYTQFDAG